VFVGRQDVVELGPERPLGNLRQAVEDPEDLILAHVVVGEEVPSGDIEGDLVGNSSSMVSLSPLPKASYAFRMRSSFRWATASSFL
jgi:hypothetical protein